MTVIPAAAADLTIGLEDEILLADPTTLDLTPRAAEVLARLDGDVRFKPELPAAQLEIVTPPGATVEEAIAVLAGGRAALRERAAGYALPIACGVHPLSPVEGELSRGERYARIEAAYRAVARRQLVSALQVHVAVSGPERSLAVYNALRSYLPEIAALAANAPFQAGRDTGLASVRPTISTMLPRQGVPPTITGWQSFAEDLEWARRIGALPDAGGWWWELRPHVTHGTLELRVPDAQTTLADTHGVAAFVHCLVARLAERHDAGEALPVHPSWRIAENRWSACRDGVQGALADLDTGTTEPTSDRLERRVEELRPVAARLRCEAGLDEAHRLCRENGAMRQRRVAQERGLHALVPWLAERFV